jgi:hypothetical protein
VCRGRGVTRPCVACGRLTQARSRSWRCSTVEGASTFASRLIDSELPAFEDCRDCGKAPPRGSSSPVQWRYARVSGCPQELEAPVSESSLGFIRLVPGIAY